MQAGKQAVSDEQLLAWVAAGDHSCLGTLFERHHRALYQYCLQLTRQPSSSEDLVQEVFMKILRKAQTFRGEGSVKAWVFHIARNESFNHLRRQKRQNTATGSDAALCEQLVDHRSAEQGAVGSQDLDLLARAFATLPATAREVIWLGRLEFDGYENLGRALGCTAAAARVRMHRAMKQLTRVLGSIKGDPSHV